MAPLESSLTRRRAWEGLLLLGFLLLCGFDLWHHDMWRDEMQPWLLARDSATIPEMFRNMRYETHPRLWYLILWAVAHFTSNPVAMQVANWLIIGSAIALFVRFCPLPLYLKAPTAFGYFFVFEWGAISRNYALGVLFCFAFCAWFPRRNRGYLGLAALLFLATQSNINAVMVAAGLAALLVFETWMDPAARVRIVTRKLDAALSALLVLGGGLLAAWNAIPKPDVDPMDNFFKSSTATGDKITSAFAAAWSGFMPCFWRDNLFAATLRAIAAANHCLVVYEVFNNPTFGAIAGMFLLALTVMFFWRSRPVFWAYPVGVALLLFFEFIESDFQLRHTGHFFLWFVICVWLAHYFPDSTARRKRAPFKLSLLQKLLFCSILFVQVLNSAVVSVVACYYPYSRASAVALYLKQRHLDQLPIFGYPDYSGMSVSGYLNHLIYYPDTQRWGTFIIENNQRHTEWNGNQVLTAIDQFAAQGHEDFLVLLGKALVTGKGDQVRELVRMGNLSAVASFSPAIEYAEDYRLYRYQAPPK